MAAFDEMREKDQKGRRLRAVCAVSYPYDTTGSQRYRWEQWEPFLRDAGIDLEFLPFCSPELDRAMKGRDNVRAAYLAARRYPSWLSELHAARDADIVIVPRKAAPAGPVLPELHLATGSAKFVYDFDDAVFLEPEGARSRIRSFLDPASRCERLIRRASLVTAGNEFLASFARKHAKNVVVVPTTVNTEIHRPRETPKPPGSPIVVGWSGSPSTARYIRAILPELREAQKAADFELLIVGAKFDLEGVRGRCEPWSSASEVPLLQEMDIGLMPLDDTDWEKGKCSLKAILYGAVGIPSIVSNVGTNPEVVGDGETGFVTRKDKVSPRLIELCQDENLRNSLGRRARIRMVEKYSARVWGPMLATRLRCLFEESPK